MTLRKFEQHSPQLGANVYVCDTALIIGQVTISDDVSIWPMTVIRGDVNSIEIGRASNVQDGCVFHVASPRPHNPDGEALIIGEQVTIGHKVLLHGCRIGNQCLIGMDTMIMDGAVVDDHVLIAAGSLVAPGKHLESGYLYQGRPARKVRQLSEAEILQFATMADHYVVLKNKYLHPGARR